MQEIAVSPIDNQFILVAFEQQLYKTINGGATWEDISPNFAFSNINYISMHPDDMNWIAMTLSGTDKRVVQSTDGGQTWADLMPGLPLRTTFKQ